MYAMTDRLTECQLPLKCGRYGPQLLKQTPIQIDFSFQWNGIVETNGAMESVMKEEVALVRWPLMVFNTSQWLPMDVASFNYHDSNQAIHGLDDEVSCVGACERNTTCQAAFYKFDKLFSKGIVSWFQVFLV
ncbi:hypothetical protein TorRG33x02_083680 [Trema orientale]|uniref:Uncharacterized protein n=1 Tax=Trema orientale TaxID=63057 RepID=A0A2P5FDH0_TREOI|nr:hypothetical protein TorRG33x02_083680 [Trema orientale]